MTHPSIRRLPFLHLSPLLIRDSLSRTLYSGDLLFPPLPFQSLVVITGETTSQKVNSCRVPEAWSDPPFTTPSSSHVRPLSQYSGLHSRPRPSDRGDPSVTHPLPFLPTPSPPHQCRCRPLPPRPLSSYTRPRRAVTRVVQPRGSGEGWSTTGIPVRVCVTGLSSVRLSSWGN